MNLRMTITESEITNMPLVVGPQFEIVFIEYKKPLTFKRATGKI